MNNNLRQIIYACFLGVFLVLAVVMVMKLRHRHQIERKTLEAHQIMRDILMEREGLIRQVPADGQWHHGQIRNSGDLLLRRKQEAPDVLEVQVKEENSSPFYLKIKVGE